MGFLGLLSGYRVPEGHFDEMREASGELRPHWRRFVEQAGALEAHDLTRTQRTVERQIGENGVTYNVYAENRPARPWALDVLPMILPAEEWEDLAQGLRQRARLLDRIAADVYGPQSLLREGLVPPALVHGNPSFLRGAHGVVPPRDTFLHVLAFDVARGPEGRFEVVGTRVQAPSGAGYALANRLVVSRLLRDAFRDLRVHMLAPFFRVLQQTLTDGAPTDGEPPQVVLLTPGPYNETYFEHAYLARYLGFTLAEGSDLTVRDDRVYLKTLAGLRRVHSILRRLDDHYCDPLELRADSALGVPGLLSAWRAGQVLVANAFGAGVLETPALHGFLPAVCARLLGEPLALPSVPTWWTGEEAALEDASPRLAEMVLKPAFPDLREEPFFFGKSDDAGQAEAEVRLRANPGRYVLEQYRPLSHAPVWRHDRLESSAVLLRVVLAADGRGDYRAMAGGLTRIAGEDAQVVSGQRGGASKETWVLSDRAAPEVSLLRERLRAEDPAAADREVSSRAGENLFWLGRYAERTQNTARLARSVLSRLPDSDAFPAGLYDVFVRACFTSGLLAESEDDYAANPRRLERDLIAGAFDPTHHEGLAFNVEQTLRTAGAVRERLAGDNWRVLNRLAHALSAEPERGAGLGEALELVDQAIVSMVAVAGLEMSHMTRDAGWRFLGLGRLVERLLFVVAVCATAADAEGADEPALLDWLLDLFDKTVTYRSSHLRAPEWPGVMHLLLFDRRNPRSAVFQLAKLESQIHLLPEAGLESLHADLRRLVALCRARDEQEGGVSSDARALLPFLRASEKAGLDLSDALTLRYFSHAYEPAQATAILG
jgi:uncharacterized circularly permuted ATP-grasp superfamily protein/uncharacterized alpha-E superfamily protein